MKKIVFVLVLFVASINIFGQIKFVSDKKDDVCSIIDSAVSYSKRHYVRSDYNSSQFGIRITYVNSEDRYDVLTLMVRIVMKNANADLEIKGNPEYQFESLEGKFLDLMQVWKLYMNPAENATDLVSKKVTYIKRDNRTFVFSKVIDTWMIKMRDI